MALKIPKNVIYFNAVMYNPQLISDPESIVAQGFPPAVLRSAVFPFDHSVYYDQEMGGGLLKYFAAFGEPTEPGLLVKYKHAAIELEEKHAVAGNRSINIDPGYLATEKIVVASTKNFTHRIYLGDGIFGDLQLMRAKGHYAPMPWTYADYTRPEATAFFNELYEKYKDLF